MKAAGVIVALVVAIALQTTLARFFARGAIAIDLVLVTVVYVALTSGPVTGMFCGTPGDAVNVTSCPCPSGAIAKLKRMVSPALI